MYRRLLPLIVGFGLGFAIVGATVAAGTLFVIGVGRHLLARSGDAAATNISFDPSTVAARSPFPAAAALLLCIAFAIIYAWLRRQERTYERERLLIHQPRGQYAGIERRRPQDVDVKHERFQS